MKKLLSALLALAVIAAFSSPILADSKNWDADKQEQIDKNRSTNAGVGNGGENWKSLGNTTAPNKNGEDGRGDDDPGNSMGNNKAGKNDKVGGGIGY